MTEHKNEHASTEDLVSYVVDRMSGRVGRTLVLKVLYLADLEARRYLGHPLSSLNYRVFHHGPFDPAIYRAIESLRDAGEIAEEAVLFSSGVGYRYSTLRPGRTYALTPAAESILSFVLKEYASKDLVSVLDVVYDTKPMKLAEGQPLNTRLQMESVDDEMRIKLGGIDLEEALQGEQDIREGRSVSWQVLRSELLDRGRPTGS